MNTDWHGLNGCFFATVSKRSVGIRGIRVREDEPTQYQVSCIIMNMDSHVIESSFKDDDKDLI